jgi:Ca2+-binding EF-hand superfamily protein
VTDFDSIDKNKDGQISFIELQKWLESSRHNFGDALQIFQNYDSNSDGRLSISEFVPLAYKLNQRPNAEGETVFKVNWLTLCNYTYAFQRFDLNNDGILTRKEMENSDKTLGPEIIEGLFLVADNNLDGQISYNEFKQISTAFGQQTEKVSSYESFR